jgi:hypothetical protein
VPKNRELWQPISLQLDHLSRGVKRKVGHQACLCIATLDLRFELEQLIQQRLG